MRKRTIKYGLDKLFWYAIYMLPLIAYVIYLLKGGYEVIPSLSTAMSNFGFEMLQTSDLFVALHGVFGSGGAVPLFASPDIILYMTYFISMWLLHLAVDFLLFIPKIACKWLDKLYGGDE